MPVICEVPKNKPAIKKLDRRRGVRIAQDVLEWLNAGELNVRNNVYLRPTTWPRADNSYGIPRNSKNAKPYVAQLKADCNVCALGACLLAQVDRYNHINLNELIPPQWGKYDSAKLADMLSTSFSRETMTLMECAFELNSMQIANTNSYVNAEKRIAAVRFGRCYYGPRERLQAIMMNVIKNRGVFVP